MNVQRKQVKRSNRWMDDVVLWKRGGQRCAAVVDMEGIQGKRMFCRMQW